MKEDSPRDFYLLGNRRKTNISEVASILSNAGKVSVIRIPPLGFGFSSRRKEVASLALRNAVHPSNIALFRYIQEFIYGLQYAGSRRFFEKYPSRAAACWNGLNGSRLAFITGAQDAGVTTLVFELSPIPGKLTCDPKGVNYLNCLPRSIEPYLKWNESRPGGSDRWKSAFQHLKQRPASSSAARPSSRNLPTLEKPYIFVALQVPNDSQLRIFGGSFHTVEQYVSAIIEAAQGLPSGWHIRIKEHPTAPARLLEVFPELNRSSRVFLDNQTDTYTQVEKSKAIFTINSSVGLQSFLYDKPVVVSGECFWGLETITTPAKTKPALFEVIQSVDTLSFDVIHRNAFMNFLVEDYFLDSAKINQEGSKKIDHYKFEVDSRTQKGWPFFN
jgi:capsular polysaccharide export protein